MTALYEFRQDMQAQIDHVTELLESHPADSEIVQDALRNMVQAEGDFNKKAERVGLYKCSLAADKLAIDTEIARLEKLSKHKAKQIASIDQYLLFQMNVLGVTEVKSALCPIKLRQNNWSVQVENAEALPPEYQRKSTTIEADKKALLANRESLGGLQGVKFDRSMSIRIG